MERGAWTSERLDDLAVRVDSGFERVDRDIRDLRAEMAAMRTELTERIEGLNQNLNQTMLRVGGALIGGMMVGFLSVIAAVLTRAS